ncbi:4-hydroxy-tetrahydrodipicolinate synthase [Paenactinomyces guangxiensis]|uniref:4-hydroxy-tetrahydrodipicolinate synthase n=1 Tax=Paenactinomyces guangxiensis TaxID=1490290 RepID=A0A7W2A8N7_9BACL|nr:4-hydroxy-tetrahydrodipicolinate synthase [Paenactinomyces guangxiensis]MBA4494389.1 4-hydroxy-tetrahydrodipicolinate synthase [Paenactinomyces guangxiensis]MBH8591556.1 4-hydroxy-tetrahydrodipicolinate synthase [Paenactinomyces guangxiensis]
MEEILVLFGRLITAMFTPFTRENNIDWTRLEECIERLIATGSDAIVVSGTTAESPNLTHEEKLQLFQFTLKKAAGRAKIIAGTGSNNTDQSIQLTKEAEETGVDGIMLVSPYYNKPSQEGLIQHFKAIAESTRLPIMLYNVPSRTSVNMSVETMVHLTEVDNIVAIKEASGDLGQISQLIAGVADDIAVYSGDDKLTLPILAVGGAGVVSVASHLVGNEMKEMINAFFSGEIQKAIALHKKLLPVFEGLFITSNPVPLKYVMAQKGWCEPYVRLPLVEMDEEAKAFTNDWMQKIL